MRGRIYICQCHTLNLSHLLRPLLCLQVQSLCLCLYSCTENRLINTIFLDSICNVFSSVTQSCLTLCDPMNHRTPGLPVHHQLPETTQTPVNWVGDAISHLILCRSLLLLPLIFPSIRDFSNESALHIKWPKYWSFSFNISPSNEHPGLISFRMDWLDLLAVQGTLKESSPTPQFKSINFLVLSFLYSPTLTSIHDDWKSHSLD